MVLLTDGQKDMLGLLQGSPHKAGIVGRVKFYGDHRVLCYDHNQIPLFCWDSRVFRPTRRLRDMTHTPDLLDHARYGDVCYVDYYAIDRMDGRQGYEASDSFFERFRGNYLFVEELLEAVDGRGQEVGLRVVDTFFDLGLI